MCTVTFIARRRGYGLAMNRDEKLTRPAGLPPRRRTVRDRTVVCPSEPGGGTWIALNDSGACLALINWYAVTARAGRPPRSRGAVVEAASAATSPEGADAAVRALPLKRINPFRLIGIFGATRKVVVWRWNLKTLTVRRHRWRTQQWISSGYDEPLAQRTRGKAFQRALHQRSAGRADWLRRLHRSHAPQAGPFSTCMHRADAETVSYTEVSVAPAKAILRHHAGAPCRAFNPRVRRLRLSKPPSGPPARRT